ncbi:MAG: anthranilate synthase component I family protein [Natronomonas sp.]
MDSITVATDEESFLETAESAPDGARIPVEVRIELADPFEAYRRVRSPDAQGFYLETTGGQSGWGYFGVDPIERIQVGPDATAVDDGSPSLAEIDALLGREELARGDCTVPYPCGGFGWLSYDVARELEDLPESAIAEGLPRLQVGVFDCIAAWQEPRSGETTIHVTACPVVSGDPASAYEAGKQQALSLARDAAYGSESIRRSTPHREQATFESECGKTAFADRVRAVQAYITDGDTFQTNISHRLVAPAVVHPVDVFSALRRVNPAPYSGLLEFPGIDLVSASPELLLSVEGDRLLTEPIAGTRPRGQTPEEDERLEADLLSDEKERAEHAMLVDLERNDLGKVSQYGSVDVSDYRRVDRYSEVMHLVSLIEGRRRDDCSIADAIGAVFPGGTITGAPKPRTMEIIDELETTRRGPYTGSIGVFGFDDRATLNITIRTLVHRDEEYYLRVGSGIVHDSVPELEYEETLDKARALVTAVDTALGERASFSVESSGAVEGEADSIGGHR